MLHVEISGVSLVHLLIVYRPPLSTGNKVTTLEFLQEFELLLTLPGEPGQFHLWPGIGQGS